MPFAEDIDWVVELSGADCRQESRLQHLVDKPLTCDRDDGLFRIRQAYGSTFLCQAAAFLGWVVFRQFHGMLARKPGALRNGAPFKDWVLPAAIERVRRKLAGADDGNRQMVDILNAVLTDRPPAAAAAHAQAPPP